MKTLAFCSALAFAWIHAALPAHAPGISGQAADQDHRAVPSRCRERHARTHHRRGADASPWPVGGRREQGRRGIGDRHGVRREVAGRRLHAVVGGRRRHLGASGGEAERALQGAGRLHVHLPVLRDVVHARPEQRAADQVGRGAHRVMPRPTPASSATEPRASGASPTSASCCSKSAPEFRCRTCRTRACRPWSTTFSAATSTSHWSRRRRSLRMRSRPSCGSSR